MKVIKFKTTTDNDYIGKDTKFSPLKNYFFIKGNVPSSKNSKQWTGKHLVWSKSCQSYKKNTKEQWIMFSEEFKKYIDRNSLEKPYRVLFKFIRGTKHKFDYINPLQTVLDLMVEYGWIDDDNADEIIPIFEEYLYDKNNAGVYIEIQ